jgi:glutamate-1-semialdehyde 2,1-aminomutase
MKVQERYRNSLDLIARAERLIPLGSQTFSKSRIQYPDGLSPLFLEKGKGGRVWDVDGNEYVDLVCGLLPVVLGYCDNDIDNAITDQLKKGITFSLPSPLEADLAERLIEIIPSAEMVRFGKNGTDVTSAAIRLSRAYTGRDHVVALGYHGWQDWYISATTRNKGIPSTVSSFTHRLPYNNLNAIDDIFEQYNGEIAAIILEPMNSEEPLDGYLEYLREKTLKHKTILIFDEIITGFRYSLGGAQELFGVTPDLSCFGKSMGNGMPISAVVGRSDIMKEMEEIFFSGTFGGETLSLAAAIAVIDKMKREQVINSLWKKGEYLANGVKKLIDKYRLSEVINLNGKYPWIILNFNNHKSGDGAAIKTLYMIEMMRNGVLVQGSHNVCYAHNEKDLNEVLKAYDITLSVIKKTLTLGRVEDVLDCPVIRPVFEVRGSVKKG